MPKYTQKYLKKPRKLPDLACRKYGRNSIIDLWQQDICLHCLELKYFPKALHSTLDPSLEATSGDNAGSRGKKPSLAKARRVNGADAAESRIAVEAEEEDGAPKEASQDDDDPIEGEDVDDDFDEDDDEGGDYDAEGYFDDGRDDIGEDIDIGDGDGGDYY